MMICGTAGAFYVLMTLTSPGYEPTLFEACFESYDTCTEFVDAFSNKAEKMSNGKVRSKSGNCKRIK